MKDDRLYLLHISESIALIEQYAAGGRAEFMKSPLIQDAILRRLQVLAESTQKLSDEVKARHPEMDWRGLAGFRNILVHDYLGVDLARVWQLLETRLPELRRQIEMVRHEFPA